MKVESNGAPTHMHGWYSMCRTMTLPDIWFQLGYPAKALDLVTIEVHKCPLKILYGISLHHAQCVLFPLRVIKPEEGKKLADSWGAAFMESSAKENEVDKYTFSADRATHQNCVFIQNN